MSSEWFYLDLVGSTAGTLVYLFLLVVVLGFRRRRLFDWLVFLALVSAFILYSGRLLELNEELHYERLTNLTHSIAQFLVYAGGLLLLPLLVHVHISYFVALKGTDWTPALRGIVIFGYLGILFLPNLLRTQWYLRHQLLGVVLCAYPLIASIMQWSFRNSAADHVSKRHHRDLCVAFALILVVPASQMVSNAFPLAWLKPIEVSSVFVCLVPGLLLGQAIVRDNFLGFTIQKNLFYTVSAAFLALIYLTLARRASVWMEPFLPPEATVSVLLFALVFFFEPIQRRVGEWLKGAMRLEMDRVQRLTAEIGAQARSGDLTRLVQFAEERIRQEFDLAFVRVSLKGGPGRPAATSGRVERFILHKGGEDLGALEAYFYGAHLSGETFAALQFLAEQLPAAIDLCRLIEEKVRLERELAERERLALLGQMAATISHNLKNPLSSMKTVLQVQLENPGLPEAIRNDSELVVNEINRLSAKLSKLLQYAKPSLRAANGGAGVEAGAAAEQIIGLLRHEAGRRGVSLHFQRDAGEIPVTCTEDAFSDVVTNLVVNAIEAVSSDGKVEVHLLRKADRLILRITDDGPGVAAESRAKILQPFFTTKAKGTGLGLAIVQRRLGEMDGTLDFESPVRDGRGSRFTVTLPIRS